MNDVASLADLLRGLRKRAGLSQEQVATRAHLSKWTVTDLERGTRPHARTATLEHLAAALEVDDADRVRLFAFATPAARAPKSDRIVEPPPHRSSPIFGRSAEIAELADTIGRRRLVTIVGLPGVGKSLVAREIFFATESHFGRGAIYLDGEMHADARSFAVSARERIAKARARDDDPSSAMLLVLDDVEHLRGFAGELEALLSESPHVHALVTAQRPLEIAGEEVWPLEPLSCEDAASLLESLLRDPRAYSRAELIRAVEELDRLPLAIYLESSSINSRQGRIASASRRRPRAALVASFEGLYDRLHSDEQRLLRLVALVNAPLDLEMVAALDDATPSDDAFIARCAALSRVNLLSRDDSRAEVRYSVPRVLRDFTRTLLDEREASAAIERFVGHMIERLREAARAMSGAPLRDGAIVWSQPAIREAFEFAMATDPQAALTIALAAHALVMTFDAALDVFTMLQRVTTAFESVLPVVQLAKAYLSLGVEAYRAGKNDIGEAYLRIATDRARVAGAADVEVKVAINAAHAQLRSGDVSTALARLEEAGALALRIGDGYISSTVEMNVAMCLAELGDTENARERLRAVLDFAVDGESHYLVASTRFLLGETWLDDGLDDSAEREADRLWEYASERGVAIGIAFASLLRAWLAIRRGRAREAAMLAADAFDVFQRNDLSDVVMCIETLALAASSARDLRLTGIFAATATALRIKAGIASHRLAARRNARLERDREHEEFHNGVAEARRLGTEGVLEMCGELAETIGQVSTYVAG